MLKDEYNVPVCCACLARAHFASEPDFPYRIAAEGDSCGAVDHVDHVDEDESCP